MVHSTKATRPPKPYSGYPLTPHATGRWCKKILGKIHYFGSSWDDWEGALADYTQKAPYLHAGKVPPSEFDIDDPGMLTVRSLSGEFLLAKKAKVDAGDLSARHFAQLKVTAETTIAVLGASTPVVQVKPKDFQRIKERLQKTLGPVALQNAITRTRSIFKWGYKNDLLEREPRFGSDFNVPAKAIRRAKNVAPSRFIVAEDIRAIIEAAKPQFRAIVMLGINCGLGNEECGLLQNRHLDLAGGWLEFARPKTEVRRRAPLWAETVAAIKEANKRIRRTKGYHYFFRTARGNQWTTDASGNSPIGREFRNLAKEVGVYRPGVSFYSLRHSFRTVADEVGDLAAVHCVMGHADELTNMDHNYVDHISDARLKAVSAHVHDWLFPAEDESNA